MNRKSTSYYHVLGVESGCSDHDLRRAYRRLAMKWHPDRCRSSPSLLPEANRRFQKIQEAYSVLSDKRKRSMYDLGLYDPEEEEDDDFSEFMAEMRSLMAEVREEGRRCSMDDLRRMFVEMVEDFDTPFRCCESVMDDHWRTAKRTRWEESSLPLEASNHGV